MKTKAWKKERTTLRLLFWWGILVGGCHRACAEFKWVVEVAVKTDRGLTFHHIGIQIGPVDCGGIVDM